MKDFVIYTVLTGGYDNIRQPLVIDDRFDYIFFSDNACEHTIGVWQVRPIPYKNIDSKRVSFYAKSHPESLLEGYKASLFHDANLQITETRIYESVIVAYSSGLEWGGIKHPYRDCIYDEAYSVYGLEKEDVIFKWCHKLRKEGYPRHNGLFENNVIFRQHNERVKLIDEMWWQCYESGPRRDQLTLDYVFWKNPNIRTGFLLSEDENVWNSSTIKRYNHKEALREKRSINETFFEHARTRCRCGMEEKVDSFREFHYWLYGLNQYVAKAILYFWGLYALMIFGTTIKYRAAIKKSISEKGTIR